MSHTTTLRSVAIRDARAIIAAVAKLKQNGVKCELATNAKPRMYYSDQGEVCEYVLRLEDGKYDVGFKKQKDGTFAPVFDEYDEHVANQIGADVNVCPIPRDRDARAQHQIGQFMQAYAEQATVNAAVTQGYTVDNATTDENGDVVLTLGNMN